MKLNHSTFLFAMNTSNFYLVFSIICSGVLASQDNVKVTLYYEALCEFCEDFINEQLYPGYQKLGDVLTMEMVLYAKHQKVDGEWNITCQHGPEECYASKIQACVLSNHTQAESMNFIGCVVSTGEPENPEYAEKCANESKLSWEDIKTCAEGKQGTELLAQISQKADNLNPKLVSVPHIVFNDKYDENAELYARIDFVATVCEMFTVKPSGC